MKDTELLESTVFLSLTQHVTICAATLWLVELEASVNKPGSGDCLVSIKKAALLTTLRRRANVELHQ